MGDLVNAIFLQSEILNLKSKKKGSAKAYVIESYIKKGNGPSSLILIKEGGIKIGDIVICKKQYGKIKSIFNDKNKKIMKADFSTPVEIIGLPNISKAGDEINSVKNEKMAKKITSNLKELNKAKIKKNLLEEYINQNNKDK